MLRLALLFLILIVYGSLYPFDEWRRGAGPLCAFLLQWPARIPRADLVQNVLAYAPFGLFLALHRLQEPSPARSPGLPPATVLPATALAGAIGAGGLLSLAMECLQQFEPARTASTADIAMNVMGTAAGALLALALHARPAPRDRSRGSAPRVLRVHDWPGAVLLHRLHHWRQRAFLTGTLPNLGLAALALWVLAQSSPLVPVLDPRDLLDKLGWFAWQLRHAARAQAAPTLVVAAQLAALGMLLRTVTRADGARSHPDRQFMVLLALVLGAKLLVYGRYLSLADAAGAALAVLVLRCCGDGVDGRRQRRTALAGAALLLAGFVLGELLPGAGRQTHGFNWMPLFGQMHSLGGLENILELFWPFFALAYFARWLTPLQRRLQVPALGALLVLALVFQLEWLQQSVPGRYGDITQVLLAVCGWLLPWSFRSADFHLERRPPAPAQQRAAPPQSAGSASSW